MALFDALGKQISEMGQGVVQQTKNLTEIAKHNSSISAARKWIFTLYGEIGQYYYERHRNDAAAEEKERIQKITQLLQEIEQHEKEIRLLKAIWCVKTVEQRFRQDPLFVVPVVPLWKRKYSKTTVSAVFAGHR